MATGSELAVNAEIVGFGSSNTDAVSVSSVNVLKSRIVHSTVAGPETSVPAPDWLLDATIELESVVAPAGSTPEPLPKSTSAFPDARNAVPCLTRHLTDTFERLDPGLFSVAVYGTFGPSTITLVDVGLRALSVGQGTSVTGKVAVTKISVPCVSCSSKFAAPGASIPLPPVVLNAPNGADSVPLPLGSTPDPLPKSM